MKPISQLPLFKKLTKDYPTKDIPFLSRQKNRFLDTQPYTGLKVILNLPITIENLINIDVLQSSGCDLYVHLFSFVPINPQAIECIKQAKIPILKNKQAPNTGVDVILDCSAELIHIKPRIGVSEITESGVAIYKATKPTYPVVSVNESKIKLLECSLGTGEAFIRAIKKLALKNITNKSFVVFGFGRVGKGIVNALLPHTSHITIVDIDIDTLQQIKKYKLKAIDATDYKAVEKAIAKSDIVVTATGIKDIMSLYEKSVFKGKILANIGVEDEFGYSFSAEEVLCEKKAINFFIDRPTHMRYLDPTFYAFNLGIDILRSQSLAHGVVHPIPSFIADEVVSEWQYIFKEKIPFPLK